MELSKITKEMIEDVELKRKLIDEKLKAGAVLTNEELWMMGDQMHLDVLPQYPQCMDMYYRRLYIHYMEDVGPAFGPLSKEHVFNFQMQVHSWLNMLNGTFPIGSLFAASKKETELEIDELNKKWEAEPNVPAEEKDEDGFRLLAWSKFRHVLVRKIFDLDIKADFYSLHLNGKEIRFDPESAMHILSRHFGHGMKPYPSVKDHFYGVFRHDQLHLDFKNIFAEIDKSRVYKNDDIADINFRYQGVVYKIWSHPIEKESSVFRISTFFSISNSNILDKLQDKYTEVSITNALAVYVKKY
jgi:hypothetical protein